MQLSLISFHLLEQLSPTVQTPLFWFLVFLRSKGILIKSFLCLILGVEKISVFAVGEVRTIHLFCTEYCSKCLAKYFSCSTQLLRVPLEKTLMLASPEPFSLC